MNIVLDVQQYYQNKLVDMLVDMLVYNTVQAYSAMSSAYSQ